MKQKISILLCLLGIFSSYTLHLGAETWEDTTDLLKALRKLRTYATPPTEVYKMTTIERKNLLQFCYEEQSQMTQDAIEYYGKLCFISEFYKNICENSGCHSRYKAYSDLVLNNDISTPDEEVLALMRESDWTQNKISDAILADIDAQQEIIRTFKLRSDPTIDQIIHEIELNDKELLVRMDEFYKIQVEYMALLSATDNVLKAIGQLLVYNSIPYEAGQGKTAIEYQNLHKFFYEEPHPAIHEASECYDKLIKVVQASAWGLFYPKDFDTLIITNDIDSRSISRETVVSLIVNADWTQDKVSEAILDHINSQQEIVEAFKAKYDPIFDSFLLDPYAKKWQSIADLIAGL